MFKYDDLGLIIANESDINGEYREDKKIIKIFNSYLNSFSNSKEKEAYKKVISEINELMDNDNQFNSQIFQRLINGERNLDNLNEYKKLLTLLNNKELLGQQSDSLGYSLEEFEADENIMEISAFKEILNESLMHNGINSPYIYDVAEYLLAIKSKNNYDYVQIDVYGEANVLDYNDVLSLYREHLEEFKLEELLDLKKIMN
ncbi:Mbov_0392 family ICE element protein [Mycoplasma sp. 125]|uniref:Mbov_0392 family ICE element protein n=1 Tax=Mycoplasma sp. 125 TaxID=3447505 RepID=UPI003F65BDC1